MKRDNSKAIFVCSLFFITSILILSSCTAKKNNATTDKRFSNEIVVAIAQDLDDSLDPHKTVKGGTTEIMFNVFEGLLKPSTSGELLPAIAKSFSTSSDGLSYTFILREGVKFHNGKTVTTADVVYSLENAKNSKISAAAALAAISEITSDEKSVTIKLDKPNNEFLSYLTVAIVPNDYAGHDTMPIGTGPFKYVSREAQDFVMMEKFEDYWGEKAQLAKVTFKIMENSDSLLMALQGGAIDLCAHLTATQVSQLQDNFNIEKDTMHLVQALFLNNDVAPFDDVRVRQAMCYAIDKHEMIDLAFDGYGSPIGSSMYPAFKKYFDESLIDYYKHDTEKAKALLREAGYPDGINITITAPSNYKPHMDTAEVLVELLSRSGIKATIKAVEWETWLSDVYVGRNFQATVTGLVANNMTARSMIERYVSNNGRNFVNYKSSEFDTLFERAINTTNDAEQVALYKQLQRNLTENAANVFLQDMADLIAVKKGLTGLRFYPIYVLDLAGVHYEK